MLFAEPYARLLLVVHVLVAAALVAVSTHLVLWLRHFPRGRFTRLRAVRIFAVVNASLFVATFIAGNLLYPVYKVRVRTEFLRSAGSVLREHHQRERERVRVHAEYKASKADDDSVRPSAIPDPKISQTTRLELPVRTVKISRWFDVKEHWVALGMVLAITCMIILLFWDPKKHGGAIAPVVFAMAVGASASAWFGALVGIVVTSYRSVGGL